MDASQANSETPQHDAPSRKSESEQVSPVSVNEPPEEEKSSLNTVEKCIVFINETLKFLMLSIFKRFKLIVHLLILLQKEDKNKNFSR